MAKFFVLDTNVILHDAECIYKFNEHTVVIPMTVIEELDNFKKDQSELGRNARAFSRYMDELRLEGPLTGGVTVNSDGGKLRVISCMPPSEVQTNYLPDLDLTVNDNKILFVARYMDRNWPGDVVILVTKDLNLRVKADVVGLVAEDYKNGKIQKDELFSGYQSVMVSDNIIDMMYDTGSYTFSEMQKDCEKYFDAFQFEPAFRQEPLPNECFLLKGSGNSKHSALVQYDAVMKTFDLLPQDMKTVDILPKNVEQQFALNLLKNPEINLVSLIGKAGSGKTLLSLAAGLYGVLETQRYHKILLLKPIVAMDNGHELGFLPGTMEEKLGPWMASYGDNIELIMNGYMKEEITTKKVSKKEQATREEKANGKINPVQELIAHGMLEFGSLEHIRGRSLPNQYIIIDECQNLSPHALKTVITRVGEGTKIVLLGDISQIDSPYLDSQSNGLSVTVEAFKNHIIAGHITLRKSERSRLAEIASEIL